MKLTDEGVALALGWKAETWDDHGHIATAWENASGEYEQAPRFTTSIDSIFAEVKKRGLDFALGDFEGGQADEKYKAAVGTRAKGVFKGFGPTAPLALCAALLAFLKKEG